MEATRFFLVTLAALLAASAVSVAGMLTFVGLIVPHMMRLVVGSDFNYLLPSSAIFGGILLIVADTVARTAFSPIEVPVGVFMSFIGAPFFPLFIEKGNAKEMILQADKLTLQYGQKIIADKLNFKVDKSEIISIIGPNGSGKSTLLKSLGRLLKPTHGTVLLEGKDIQKMKPGDIARKMSILPQSSTAPMDMTVYDLVCYGRMPHQGLFLRQIKLMKKKSKKH